MINPANAAAARFPVLQPTAGRTYLARARRRRQFCPGTHDFSYRDGDPPSDFCEGSFFRGVHGTAEQPITIRGESEVRLRAFADDPVETAAVTILQSSHIIVEGFDISRFGSAVLVADSLIVLYLVQNATTGRWLLENLDNDSTQKPLVFTTIPESSPLGFDHAISGQAGGAIAIAWEDIEGGGDQNFTDLVVEVTFDPLPLHVCFPVTYDPYAGHHPHNGGMTTVSQSRSSIDEGACGTLSHHLTSTSRFQQ